MPEKKGAAKRKVNLLKLHTHMHQISHDAVDKEITKRFKTVVDSAEEDISKNLLASIMKHYDTLDLNQFGEGMQPYIRHYIFMLKRSN